MPGLRLRQLITSMMAATAAGGCFQPDPPQPVPDAAVVAPAGIPCTKRKETEDCNGVDDNCNGAVDEGFLLDEDASNCGVCGNRCFFANADARCEAKRCAMGDCRAGYLDLDRQPGNGCEYRCTPSSATEDCSTLVDDNCDGRVNEGCTCNPQDPNHVTCGSNLGICRSTMVCGPDGQYRDCHQDVKALDAELCNGVDDDCDGAIDEGFRFDLDPANCGACGHQCFFANAQAVCRDGRCALAACSPDYWDLDRQPENGCEYHCTKRAESDACDNRLDDDCDGEVNEDCVCDPRTKERVECGSNIGICRSVMACGPDGHYHGCQALVPPATTESCNGVDDDCDGTTDEGFDVAIDPENCGSCGHRCFFANAAGVCAQGQCTLGECRAGYRDLDRAPDDGCEYKCPVMPPAAADACFNRLDDDCNGQVDDGCPAFPDGGGTGGPPDAGVDAVSSVDGPPPIDGPPLPQAPPVAVVEFQSNVEDPNSHAESVVCGKESGLSMDFEIACHVFPDKQYPYAQCKAMPSSTGTFDMDAFDLDNQGRGALEVRFCLKSLDGGPITGDLNLWYGEYPRRKLLKLLTGVERQGVPPGCYVRTFSPEDPECAKFLLSNDEASVKQQIPAECRFDTQQEADAFSCHGRWKNRSPLCGFSYRDKPLWTTSEACLGDVHARIEKLNITYYPEGMMCRAANTCLFGDRPRCESASDAPGCDESRFFCGGLCQPTCDGAGQPCEVHLSGGVTCMSTLACLDGMPVCPASGCAGTP